MFVLSDTLVHPRILQSQIVDLKTRTIHLYPDLGGFTFVNTLVIEGEFWQDEGGGLGTQARFGRHQTVHLPPSQFWDWTMRRYRERDPRYTNFLHHAAVNKSFLLTVRQHSELVGLAEAKFEDRCPADDGATAVDGQTLIGACVSNGLRAADHQVAGNQGVAQVHPQRDLCAVHKPSAERESDEDTAKRRANDGALKG
ncbi:hypothetical protein EYF80_001452 [Liparis tanakae]|uniref:Uncharacterized protein n=1 Tax=Liparis tanakae TaxID=230148 RepID=A0A4Z2JDB4_9TELE|nr:hypothetical protein EYF80_001452 [Liparis tanakae]